VVLANEGSIKPKCFLEELAYSGRCLRRFCSLIGRRVVWHIVVCYSVAHVTGAPSHYELHEDYFIVAILQVSASLLSL